MDAYIVKFAHKLTGRLLSKHTRDQIVKEIQKYVEDRCCKQTPFSEFELIRLWKSLFYGMYNADLLIPQEEYADNICELIHKFRNSAQKQEFFKAGIVTFTREWQAIDAYRLDKYMLFAGRLLRNTLLFLKETNWDFDEIKKVVESIENELLVPDDDINDKPLGLKLHFTEICLPELAKIGGNKLSHPVIMSFLLPFLKVFVLTNQSLLVKKIDESIITWIIMQELPDESSSSVDEEETELDPRAGGVDITIPTLNLDRRLLAKALRNLSETREIHKTRRKLASKLAYKLENSTKEDFTVFHKTKNFVNLRKIERNTMKSEVHVGKKRRAEDIEKEINKYKLPKISRKMKSKKKVIKKDEPAKKYPCAVKKPDVKVILEAAALAEVPDAVLS